MLKRILKKLLRIRQAELPYKAGENSSVRGAVLKYAPESEIVIGKDCLIEGKLIAYRPEARITIGDNVFVGGNSMIGAAESITIGNDVLISFDCVIQDNDSHHTSYEIRRYDNLEWKSGQKSWKFVPMKPIVIRNGAWIGARCIILKGITIGEGAVVGSGSVVTKDVEPYTVVAGNPARFIRKIQ